MIGRLQGRFTPLSIAAALVYATLTLFWVAASSPVGSRERLLPALLTIVSLGAAVLKGPANLVTWSRAWLAGPAYFYALEPSRFGWLALTVVIGSATDVLDGLVARRFAVESSFGGALDPVVDGIFYGAIALGLWLSGLFAGWLALVVLARYALPALAGGVLLASGRRPELRHTVFGQVSTTVIAVVLGGAALLRAGARDPHLLLQVGYVAVPAASLLAFGNLAWTRLSARSDG